MATKSFAKAPKPNTNRPSPEAIAQFERGGLGTDQASEQGRGLGTKPTTKVTRTSKKLQEASSDEATKRLSVDIPESLHRRFKVACASSGVNMGAEIQRFLKKRTEQLESS